MTSEFTISARRVAARYGHREVFHDVSFDLRSGQAVGVVGENGAGKTTLLRALVGLIRPAQGEIRIAGLPSEDALRRIPTAYFAEEATLPGRARWLSRLLTSKRDRESAVVVSSHRLHDLADICDAYLFVVNHRTTYVRAFERSPVGPVTAAVLTGTFDQLRGGHAWG